MLSMRISNISASARVMTFSLFLCDKQEVFSVADDGWMSACFKDDFHPHSPFLLVLVQLVSFLHVMRR